MLWLGSLPTTVGKRSGTKESVTVALSPAANDGMADRSKGSDFFFMHSLHAGSAASRKPALVRLKSIFSLPLPPHSDIYENIPIFVLRRPAMTELQGRGTHSVNETVRQGWALTNLSQTWL